MIASLEYIGSDVIAVLPKDNLKLITTVFSGIKEIPLSLTALSERNSFVSKSRITFWTSWYIFYHSENKDCDCSEKSYRIKLDRIGT